MSLLPFVIEKIKPHLLKTGKWGLSFRWLRQFE